MGKQVVRLYKERIATLCGDYDVRHVEAYIRLEHPRVDVLPVDELAEEVELGMRCIEAQGVQEAERLARSFGL